MIRDANLLLHKAVRSNMGCTFKLKHLEEYMVYTCSLDSVDKSSVNKIWSAEFLFQTHFPGSLERPNPQSIWPVLTLSSKPHLSQLRFGCCQMWGGCFFSTRVQNNAWRFLLFLLLFSFVFFPVWQFGQNHIRVGQRQASSHGHCHQ